MGFDIRLPIGWLFVIVGALLATFGLLGDDKTIYERSLGINVNLWWGLAMTIFGLTCLWLSRCHGSPSNANQSSAEAHVIETRERSDGLEKADTH